MIAPASSMWRLASSAPLKALFDHPQSSLKPQGTLGPPGLPVVVRWVAEAPAGASRIATTLATAARQRAIVFLPADALPSIAPNSPSLTVCPKAPRLAYLLHLVVVDLDRGLAAEDRDQHLELGGVLVDLGDLTGEVRKRTRDHLHGLADRELRPRPRTLRRLAMEEAIDLDLGERD